MHTSSTSPISIPITIVVTPSFATGVITGAVGVTAMAYVLMRYYERKLQPDPPSHPFSDDGLPILEMEAEEVIIEEEEIILEAEPKGE